MPYNEKSVNDHVVELYKRIGNVETAVFDSAIPQADEMSMAINGISHSISTNPPDSIGRVSVTLNIQWDPVDTVSNDGAIHEDKVFDYMVSITEPDSPITPPFRSTGGKPRTSVTLYSSGSVVVRVYAISKNSVRGPEFQRSITVTVDYGVPQQPATPELSQGLGYVAVQTSGLSVEGNPYNSHIKYFEVHATSGNVMDFLPAVSTFKGTTPVGSSYVISADGNYGEITVKLVAVNIVGTKSPPSTGAVESPKKVIQEDMGVVVSAEFPYSDTDNLIINGSFENESLGNALVAKNKVPGFARETFNFGPNGISCIAFSGATNHSTEAFYVMGVGDGRDSQFPRITIDSKTSYVLTYFLKRDGVDNNDYRVEVAGTLHKVNVNANQTVDTSEYKNIHQPSDRGTKIYSNWKQYSLVIPPTTAKSNEKLELSISIKMIKVTEGKLFADAFNIRRVLSSQYIQNAAITSAHIANLAVKNQHVENVEAGKITSGVLQANEYIATGNLARDHTKLDKDGLKVYKYNYETEEHILTSHLGDLSNNTNVFSLYNSSGNNVFFVNANQNVTRVQSLNTSVNGEVFYKGQPLSYYINQYDRFVAFGNLHKPSDTIGTINAGQSTRVWAFMCVRTVKNLYYEFEISNIKAQLINNSSGYLTRLTLYADKFLASPPNTKLPVDSSISNSVGTTHVLMDQSAYPYTVTPMKFLFKGNGGLEIIKIGTEISTYKNGSPSNPDIRGRFISADVYIRQVGYNNQNLVFVTGNTVVGKLTCKRQEIFRDLGKPTITAASNTNECGFKKQSDKNPRHAVFTFKDGNSIGHTLGQDYSYYEKLTTFLSNNYTKSVYSARLFLVVNFSRKGSEVIRISTSDDVNATSPTSRSIDFNISGNAWSGWIDISSIFPQSTRAIIISTVNNDQSVKPYVQFQNGEWRSSSAYSWHEEPVMLAIDAETYI